MQRDPDPGSMILLFGVLVLLGFFVFFAWQGALPDWGRLFRGSMNLPTDSEGFWLIVCAAVAGGALFIWLFVGRNR